MLKILNIFTLPNLNEMKNLSQDIKDMLINYALQIKKTGKRQITLNKVKKSINEKNEEVSEISSMKKVKIDYF